MVIDLKLSRLQDVPWGFRLAGGIDYDLPLTVIKVVENSIAEKAGLKVGDIIVRINDTSTINLGHHDVHDIIMSCANSFVFGVARKGLDDEPKVDEPTNGYGFEPVDERSLFGQIQSPDSQAYSEVSETTINSNGVESISEKLVQNVIETIQNYSITDDVVRIDTTTTQNGIETTKGEITDEHIAEMMSGEAEVLKEHNVIGVNFQRIIPKASIFKSSEVFKQLNEEATKTKAEKEKEVKKWTTFLQKPDRPIPKSRADFEIERRIPYKVNITKQPKPRCDPTRGPSPPPVVEPPTIEPTTPDTAQNGVSNGDAATDTNVSTGLSDEVKVNEDVSINGVIAENGNDICNENGVEEKPDENGEAAQNVENGDSDNTANGISNETEPEQVLKSPQDILLEKQLSDVQKQLLALSSLPSTIQATLDAVTKQIEELMPAFKQKTAVVLAEQKQPAASEEETLTEREEKEEDENGSDKVEPDANEIVLEGTPSCDGSTAREDSDSNITTVVAENGGVVEETVTHTKKEIITSEIECSTDEEIAKLKTEKTFRKLEEEWVRKREKEQKQLSLEQQQRLIAHQISKRPVRSINGGPRTPQERPLVLPGGRKWRSPKDAYNEEFIAEVISSQAELITGSTLGHTFESPLLGYDDRIIEERYSEYIKKPLPFENCEYEIRITGTISTDKRIMAFINTMWGFEVTGGSDQFEPLTVIAVSKTGCARRAGIRVGDIITRINNTYTDDMTLLQAQLLILKSGKHVQIFVQGDAETDEDDEYTVDFWFKPPRKRFPPIKVENKWPDGFPWNDRRKPVYKESNCFMVPSKNEDKIHEHDTLNAVVKKEPIVVTESDDNVTATAFENNEQTADMKSQKALSDNTESAVNQVPDDKDTNKSP